MRAIGAMSSAGILAVLLGASHAFAGEGDVKAQVLYDDAKTLVAAERWTEACPKLEESQKLAPKMNTAYRLAECYEHIGKRASAWRRYRDAAIAATQAGETGKAKAALERAEKLEPTLPKLVVDSKASKETELRLDGAPVAGADVGVAVAIDPGVHELEARASHKKTFRTSVTIPDDASTTTLVVPALEDETATTAGPKTGQPDVAIASPSRRSSATVTVGIVMVGTGIAALGVGGYLALSARSKYHDADAHCPPSGCDDVGAAATSDAQSLGNIATAVIGAGLAIGVTGAVLWITAPSSTDAAHAKSTQPSLSLSLVPGGMLLRGAF